ncbi:MAG: metal-dependent hydrolase [Acidobacteria bacterium]|nr:metal-dependent hydrolase [Acidobacteriota bacterium]
MDNLTHTLTAVALSHTGLNRKTRFATLTVIAGANLPDVDVVTWLKSTATYLHYHRGITHSLLGIIVLGVVAGLLGYAIGRRAGPGKQGLPANIAWLVACGLVGSASHLLLDFTNAYGVRPFLPFSGRWYAWDIMFITDPGVMSLLAVGLGFPVLLRLISEEVGAGKPAYRTGAFLALAAVVLVWTLRDIAHRRAVTLLDSVQFGQENPKRVGAFPSPINPFSWTGVAETESAFYVVAVSALDDHIQTGDAQVYRKPEESAALDAAMKTRTGSVFLDFARFPWGQVQVLSDDYEVTLRDLRFTMPGAGRSGFVVRVDLDKNLRVRSESFSFRMPRD